MNTYTIYYNASDYSNVEADEMICYDRYVTFYRRVGTPDYPRLQIVALVPHNNVRMIKLKEPKEVSKNVPSYRV